MLLWVQVDRCHGSCVFLCLRWLRQSPPTQASVMSSDPASDAQSTPMYPRQCSHMWGVSGHVERCPICHSGGGWARESVSRLLPARPCASRAWP